MLSELCRELKNWFIRSDEDKHIGNFIISDNTISSIDYLSEGQYFRIVGSVLNDGVYRYGDKLFLHDEEFHGAIWAMSVPFEVIMLDSEIEAWKSKYEEQANSPFVSESFGGYSYTKTSQNSTGATSWQKAFSSRLSKWRKI